jgi:hypothetical protein
VYAPLSLVWLVLLTLLALLALEQCCVLCGKVKGGEVTDGYLNEILIYDKMMIK